MNYRNAKKYLNTGRFDCEIEHPVYGWIPYTADANDTGSGIDNTTLLASLNADATVQQVAEEPTAVQEVQNPEIAATATTEIDLAYGPNFVVSLTTSTTLSFLNPVLGQSGVIFLQQDATGGRTITLPANAKTPLGGAAIAQHTAANSISMLSYVVMDASNILVNYIGNYA